MNSSVSMYESSEKSMKHMQLKGMGKGLMILTWGFFATAVAFFVLGYLDDKDVAEWLKWTTCIVLLIFLIIWALLFVFGYLRKLGNLSAAPKMA